ncbi:hypothetical protein O0I10_004626 [Lichtheimia ornata]|uniref:MADS-box domain-containing protein n=1 Tax=Lichtheimia ornata TaxID=688661 RepID=A0AAD7Y222_9FUNG|nr:uncharacterized protein O0I10_004626 [Lichtheimia ornata]KAJ8659647.1 hypothetical protein O0I10_004626 [Lichtheimia ornata]
MNTSDLDLSNAPKKDKALPVDDDGSVESDEEKPTKRSGRRKIKIEYIQDKNRRHITFSKRKAGIMKKAYELSTLTGTQVLLLVVSETGLVYTFTTVKLQPIVTKPEGKNLIQACLNAPDPEPASSPAPESSYNTNGNGASSSPSVDKNKMSPYEEKKPEGYPPQQAAPPQPPTAPQQAPPTTGYQPYVGGNWNGHHPGYVAAAAAAAAGVPYQQQGGGAPPQAGAPPHTSPHHYPGLPSYYNNQPQQQYMPQHQHAGYWAGSRGPSHPSMQRPDTTPDAKDDKQPGDKQ